MPLTGALGSRCPEKPASTSSTIQVERIRARILVEGNIVEMITSIAIRDSRLEPSAVCIVCGGAIPAGEGLTARHGDRILRFKCSGCLSRFRADPNRYLEGHKAGCCDEAPESSPASEWRCD